MGGAGVAGAEGYDPLGAWHLFGRLLAAVNLVFWGFNLFGFLIPVFLPRAFKRHFEMELAAKREEEKGQ